MAASITICPFHWIYWGAYFSWGINYILAARENRDHCRRCITADMIAKALCFVIFLLLPTTIARPEAGGSGLIGWLTRIIYMADTPVTLFPPLPGFLAVLAVFSEV